MQKKFRAVFCSNCGDPVNLELAKCKKCETPIPQQLHKRYSELPTSITKKIDKFDVGDKIVAPNFTLRGNKLKDSQTITSTEQTEIRIAPFNVETIEIQPEVMLRHGFFSIIITGKTTTDL